MIEDNDLILGDDMTVLDRMESLLAPAGAGDEEMDIAEVAANVRVAINAGLDPKSELSSILVSALRASVASGTIKLE